MRSTDRWWPLYLLTACWQDLGSHRWQTGNQACVSMQKSQQSGLWMVWLWACGNGAVGNVNSQPANCLLNGGRSEAVMMWQHCGGNGLTGSCMWGGRADRLAVTE
jgi:hypothetical protein